MKIITTSLIVAISLSTLTVAAQEESKKKPQDDFEQYKKNSEQDFQDFKNKREAELKKMKDEYQDYYNEMMGLKKYYAEKKDTAKLNVVDGIISYEKSINDALGDPMKVTENVKFDPGNNNQPVKVETEKKDEPVALTHAAAQPAVTAQPTTSAIDPSLAPLTKANAIVTSPFGLRMHPILKRPMKHNGVDLGAKFGSEIYAAGDGKVILTNFNSISGNYLVVEHKDGQSSSYAHLSKIAVSKGDMVSKGQIVGYVGSTGRSTGPHLHYEVRTKGTPVDPKNYLLEYK